MNNTIKSHEYSQRFMHYVERIMELHQAKIRGEVIVAKPVLMLALIDGIDSGVFTNNRFVLNEWLEERYLKLASVHSPVTIQQTNRNQQSLLAFVHRWI